MSTYTETLKLNTGATIPAVGLGTWQAGPNEVGEAVKTALDAGYRHLDLAYVYENEKEIGVALHAWLKANPSVKRSDLFITSKLWNTFHRPSDVPKGLEATLNDLQLDYLDLYLMHWPVAFAPDGPKGTRLTPRLENGELADETAKVPVIDTYKAMVQLVDTGKVKAVGVSNFTVLNLTKLIEHKEVPVPAVNQVELHPYLPQDDLLTFCKSKGIVLTAYSPLGGPSGKSSLRDDPVVAAIAKKHGVEPGQVLIAWAVHRGTAVIPKSANPKRIQTNFRKVNLDDDDMKQLATLAHHHVRTCDSKLWWKLDVDVFDTTKPRVI